MRFQSLVTLVLFSFFACKASKQEAAHVNYVSAYTDTDRFQLYLVTAKDALFSERFVTFQDGNKETEFNAYCLYAYRIQEDDSTPQAFRMKSSVRVASHFTDYNKAYSKVDSIWHRLFKDGFSSDSSYGFVKLVNDEVKVSVGGGIKNYRSETINHIELESLLQVTRSFATSTKECPTEYPYAQDYLPGGKYAK